MSADRNRSLTPARLTTVVLRLVCVGMLLAAACGLSSAPGALASPAVDISSGSEQILDSMLAADDNNSGVGPAARSELISRQFLGTPYGADTLVGSATVPEQLVVELQRVDCFTYADYVEAFKRSNNRDEFLAALTDVRYKDGVVAFANRKHFFTDWAATAPAVATDVTTSLSDKAIRRPRTSIARTPAGCTCRA